MWTIGSLSSMIAEKVRPLSVEMNRKRIAIAVSPDGVIVISPTPTEK